MYSEELLELDPLFADFPTKAQLGIDNDHEAYIYTMEIEEYADNVNWWVS